MGEIDVTFADVSLNAWAIGQLRAGVAEL